MASVSLNNNETWSFAIWKSLDNNDDGLNALHLAANQGQEESVRALVEAGDHMVNEPTSLGRTALCFASFGGFQGIVVFLCRSNANVSLHCTNGWTCLMSAALQGHLDVAEELVANKIDVNAKTTSGLTALMIASENGHIQLLKYLLSKNADINAKTVGASGLPYR
ncbi:protein fem-1 B [Biomphalaria glabrata]